MYVLIREGHVNYNDIDAKGYKTLEDAQKAMIEDYKNFYNEEEPHIGMCTADGEIFEDHAWVYMGIEINWKIVKVQYN